MSAKIKIIFRNIAGSRIPFALCLLLLRNYFNGMLQASISRHLAYETKRGIHLRQSKMEFKLSAWNFNDDTCATSNGVAARFYAAVTSDFLMVIYRRNANLIIGAINFYIIKMAVILQPFLSRSFSRWSLVNECIFWKSLAVAANRNVVEAITYISSHVRRMFYSTPHLIMIKILSRR